MDSTQEKLKQLQALLVEMESVVVAYSGGVDSTLLLKVAHDTLGDRALGLTAISASMPSLERLEAQAIAEGIGARYATLASQELEDPNYLANPSDRCFFCKRDTFARLVAYAQEHGYRYVLDGTNADDTGDHRPGQLAARQYGVRSPLLETGLTKAEIRSLARQFGLPNWDKPAAACLSSRIPYGAPITLQKLSQVEQAELYLRSLGLRQFRVRHHDLIARIEAEPKDFSILIEQRQAIQQTFKEIGFTYITLDLAGFRSGSLNEVLPSYGR